MISGRYYITSSGEPYFNMAFDEWLLISLNSERSFPRFTLRLYSWSSPAITIGYNQSIEKAVDYSLIQADIPVIRRITGGRAIYHEPSELTYTVVADRGVIGGKVQSVTYLSGLISSAVADFMEEFGLSPDRAEDSNEAFRETVGMERKSCFDSISRHEISSNGIKIAGGAQRQVGSGMIQQGSIKINGIEECAAVGQRGYRLQEMRSDSQKYTIEDVCMRFGEEFSRHFGIDLERRELIDDERPGIEKKVLELKENCLIRR